MSRAEQNDLAYLFRLRMTANVKRDLVRAMPSQRLGRMLVKDGKARKPVCACMVGAGIAVLFCCAAKLAHAHRNQRPEAILPKPLLSFWRSRSGPGTVGIRCAGGRR